MMSVVIIRRGLEQENVGKQYLLCMIKRASALLFMISRGFMRTYQLLLLGLVMGIMTPLSCLAVQISISPNTADTSNTTSMTPEEQQAAHLQSVIDQSAKANEALKQGSSMRYTRKTEAQAKQDAEAARISAYKLQQQQQSEAAAAAREANYNDVQKARADRDAAFTKQNAARQAEQQLNMQKYTDPAAYSAATKQKE